MTTNLFTPAQSKWLTLEYGMFLHFGANTVSGVAWGDGAFDPQRFAPDALNCKQWAEIAREAGMRYAVLTAKHHDGFCLWPTELTHHSIKAAAVRRDVVGEFVSAMRDAGIVPGLYYSLWDRNFPQYEDDGAYADFMQAQVAELLDNYGSLTELWFDGGWDKEHPTRDWRWNPDFVNAENADILAGSRWRWREMYELIHTKQADCLVVNNSSSDRPGIPRYHPVDIRTAEHFDFVMDGKRYVPETKNDWATPDDETVHLPLEYCTSLNPDWFHIGGKHFIHPSVATIAGWRTTARANGANLLLNVGPDRHGRIPEVHREYLNAARKITN
ncbi:MAG: alpha-L-fucosidase [Armatimonadetes bacterium]|nr:alpha-L-fucosidase [Armatimonadota bacterium]